MLKHTVLHAFNDLSSSIDKLSFKTNSMSLGLVLMEKLFMQMWTPQSDAIMSGDSQPDLMPHTLFMQATSVVLSVSRRTISEQCLSRGLGTPLGS